MAATPDITIVEVGPRDGLQNEKQWVATADKIAFIDKLSATGLQRIEATSFVAPQKIPQTRDNAAVFSGIQKATGVSYPVLVPNEEGMHAALAAGVKEVAVFTAASEAFAQRNINCSIEESLQRFEPVLALAQEHDIRVRGYVSCIFACPFSGKIDSQQVHRVVTRLLDMGCYEISLGDTTGVGTVADVQRLLPRLLAETSALAVHFHDTYGQALANIYAALELGITVIDSAVSGLGGCPYARGATGNVATEDVLYMLDGLGLSTGIDKQALFEVSVFISEVLQRQSQSKVTLAQLAQHKD